MSRSRISRYRKRESDRSGFDYKRFTMINDEGSLVGPDEFDTPPPSDRHLGGEGDVSVGDMRSNADTDYTTPSENDRRTFYITSGGGISYSDVDPWLYIVGSNETVDITKNPQITSAPHNRVLTLECVGSSVVLEDGSGLSLRKAFVMDSGAIISLIYNATDNLWYETSRSHRTKMIEEN